MKSCVSAKANSEASSTGTEMFGGTVQAVDQRFHGADKPRGQYEVPIAVVVLRAVKLVQVIPEPGGKLRDELARLPGGRFQPFGIGQRFRRHIETGFFG